MGNKISKLFARKKVGNTNIPTYLNHNNNRKARKSAITTPLQQQLNEIMTYSFFIVPTSSETSKSESNTTITIYKNKTENMKSFNIIT